MALCVTIIYKVALAIGEWGSICEGESGPYWFLGEIVVFVSGFKCTALIKIN